MPCVLGRAADANSAVTVEFSPPLFSLATQTEPRLPRSTGRRNIKLALTTRLFHGDLTFLCFVAPQSHALQCSFNLTVPRAPVRISAFVSNRFDLGVPTIPAGDEVSPMVYNPRLIRVRIQIRMTHKRTRLLNPTSTALAAVGARLSLRGRQERPAIHLHLLRREWHPFCFFIYLNMG
jgi:hypothetical protein